MTPFGGQARRTLWMMLVFNLLVMTQIPSPRRSGSSPRSLIEPPGPPQMPPYTPRPKWFDERKGISCNDMCEKVGLVCTEDHWPATMEEWQAIEASALIQSCRGTWPGGAAEAPVRINRTGLEQCLWQGPSRSWANYYSPSRCSVVPSLDDTRICPCVQSTPGGGMVLWPPKDTRGVKADRQREWRVYGGMHRTKAGVQSITSLATAAGDIMVFRTRNSSSPATATHVNKGAVNDKWFPLSYSSRWAATDNAVATVNGTQLAAWLIGEPSGLPYYVKYESTPRNMVWGPVPELVSPDTSFGEYIPASVLKGVEGEEIADIVATRGAFAVLLRSGKVFCWGDKGSGGSCGARSEASKIQRIVATRGAFAAITSSGRVEAWGDQRLGGALPDDVAAMTDVIMIAATQGAFAALSSTHNEVKSWGHRDFGGFLGDMYSISRNNVSCREGFRGISSVGECREAIKALGAGTDVKEIFTFQEPKGCWRLPEEQVTYNHIGYQGRGSFYKTTYTCKGEHDPLFTVHNATLEVCKQKCDELAAFCKYIVVLSNDSCMGFRNIKRDDETPAPGAGAPIDDKPPQASDEGESPESLPEKTCYVRDPQDMFCMAREETAVQLARGSVHGVYATSRQFLAVTKDGVLLTWPTPHALPKDIGGIRGVQAVYPSELAFAVLHSQGLVLDTVWGAGTGFGDWIATAPSPRSVGLPQPPSDVKSTSGAFAVRSTGVSVWHARPPAMEQFYSYDYVGCNFGDGISSTSYVQLRDYSLFGYPFTRSQCAELCLQFPNCTGFEYPSDGSYCSPWFSYACSHPGSKGWLLDTKEPSNYELYIRKTAVLPVNMPPPTTFLIKGSGECAGRSAYHPYLRTQLSHAECEAECRANHICTGFAISATGGCLMYDRQIMHADGSESFTCYARGGGLVDRDEVNSTLPSTPSTLSTRPAVAKISQLILRNGLREADIPLISPTHPDILTEKVVLSDFTVAVGEPIEVTSASGLPFKFSQFRIITSAADPAFDPVTWKVEVRRTNQNSYVDITPPSSNFRQNKRLLTSLARRARGRWVPVKGCKQPNTCGRGFNQKKEVCVESHGCLWSDNEYPESCSCLLDEEEITHVRLTVTDTRGTPVFHRMIDYGCVWKNPPYAENRDYIIFSQKLPYTVEECAAICFSLANPANCTGFEFPADGSYCAPWIGGACTHDGKAERQIGYELYVLSNLSVADTFDMTDYGGSLNRSERAPPPTMPSHISISSPALHATDKAFAAVGPWNVTVWGDEGHGGSFGEAGGRSIGWSATHLTHVADVVPLHSSFAALAIGESGFDECYLTEACSASPWTSTVAEKEQKDYFSFAVCNDTNTASWSTGDYRCFCIDVLAETTGEPAPCEPGDFMHNWLFLGCEAVAMLGLYLSMLQLLMERRARRARVESLLLLYGLHATEGEEKALSNIIATNKSRELELLTSLIPCYKERREEVLTFLMWQYRIRGTNAVTVLPRDLLWGVQCFVFGPISIPKIPRALMTPLGWALAKVTLIASRWKRRRASDEAVVTSEPWPEGLVTPLLA